MAFTVPTFNLNVNQWFNPDDMAPVPPVAAPDFRTFGNLCWGKRTPAFENEPYGMWLLLPAGTQVDDGFPANAGGDLFEVPAGSGRYYQCFYADNVAMGFANEHVCLSITKANRFPSGPGPGSPWGPPSPTPPIFFAPFDVPAITVGGSIRKP